jgi:hypothetical protein
VVFVLVDPRLTFAVRRCSRAWLLSWPLARRSLRTIDDRVRCRLGVIGGRPS